MLSSYTQTGGNYLFLQLPSDEAARLLCSRSILIRTIHKVWAVGDSIDEIVNSLQKLPQEFFESYFAEQNSWSIQVDSFCKTFTMQQKNDCRDRFRFLNFKGPVVISNPMVELWLILDYSRFSLKSALPAKEDSSGKLFIAINFL